MSHDQQEHIRKIRNDFQASQRIKDSLNNSIKALAEDLYSKDTHFIFELIQNAEDNSYGNVGPFISFWLMKTAVTKSNGSDGTLIIQNNEIGFSSKNVDALCAVGKTTKSKIQGYIGEKGIGFKSVFRITSNPYVISGGYQFSLPEHDGETGLGYIVPRWIDLPIGKIDPTQTTIILPLDKADFSYSKIEEMLRDIEPETILFLSKIKEIRIISDSGNSLSIRKDDSKSPLVQILVKGEQQGISFSNNREFILFNESFEKPEDIHHEKRIDIKERDVSIVFPLNEDKEGGGKIFAYLPVRSDTGFPFIINADFILTSSREDFKRGTSWNRWLMQCVAKLVVGGLSRIKELGLLKNEFLETLAKSIKDINEYDLFYPINQAVWEAFRDHELLPCDDEKYFISARNGLLARGSELRKLLSVDQLRNLILSEGDHRWLSGEITEGKTPNLYKYLTKECGVEEITPEGFVRKLTSNFLEMQSDEWMIIFYKYVGNLNALWKPTTSYWSPAGPLRSKKFIRLQDGSHVRPFQEDDSPNAYLANELDTQNSLPLVKFEIARQEDAHQFLKELGIPELDIVAEVMEQILPKYISSVPIDEHRRDIEKIVHAYETDSEEKKRRLRQKLQETSFILSVSPGIGATNYRKPNEVYFKNKGVETYFSGNLRIGFVCADYTEAALNLFSDLGVKGNIRIQKKEPNNLGYVSIRNDHGFHVRGLSGFDLEIRVDGLEHAIANPNIEKSSFIWNAIASPNLLCIRGIVETSSRQTYENSKKNERISSDFGRLLIETAWLPKRDGNFYKPEDISLDDLPESYIRDEKLANQLGMKKALVAKLAEEAGISQEIIEVARELERHPELLAEFRKRIQPGVLEERKKTDETAPGETDFKNELVQSFNRLGRTELNDQNIDDGTVKNPVRRRDKSYDGHFKHLQHEPNANERRKITIRMLLEGPDDQVREYLTEMYGGNCQICGTTFPERDGHPFFVANYIVPRKVARAFDTSGNALCLCADHFAKWQHGAIEAKDILFQIERYKTGLEGGDVEPILAIMMCGQRCEIKFKEKHLVDLQEIIRASENINEK